MATLGHLVPGPLLQMQLALHLQQAHAAPAEYRPAPMRASDAHKIPPPSPASPQAGKASSGSGTPVANPKLAAARAEIAGLAALASSGDEGAFEELARRLRPAIVRLYMERGAQPALAEDLSQRAALGLWQALTKGRYDPARAAITTFAFAVAIKVWLQHLRANGRLDAAMDRYTKLVARGRTGADQPNDGEHAALLQTVREALLDGSDAGMRAGLTSDERWLLRSWAGGQSDRDLAKALGIAPSNVNVRKQRAYAKLRQFLITLGWEHQGSP
jgi:RNA polymerase sigma factor (sigma-70 family)